MESFSLQAQLIGFSAIVGSWISYGSFGMPIKTKRVVEANVNPIVYQAYKSVTVFILCWLVLTTEKFYFTYWGVISALIWVPNGTLAILAFKLAGISICQALMCGFGVMVSFIWGAVIFHENIQSWPLALTALSMMGIGMLGMSLSFQTGKKQEDESKFENSEAIKYVVVNSDYIHVVGDNAASSTDSNDNRSMSSPCLDNDSNREEESLLPSKPLASTDIRRRKTLGIIIASCIGISTGSIMVPLHYAPPEAQGVQFVISFACGALTVSIIFYTVYGTIRALLGYSEPFPSFHFRAIAVPAFCTGLLWTTGYFCGLYSTLYLGNAIGNSSVQGQIVVSGMWGILYYREVTDRRKIALFFMSMLLTLGGVVLLAFFG